MHPNLMSFRLPGGDSPSSSVVLQSQFPSCTGLASGPVPVAVPTLRRTRQPLSRLNTLAAIAPTAKRARCSSCACSVGTFTRPNETQASPTDCASSSVVPRQMPPSQSWAIASIVGTINQRVSEEDLVSRALFSLSLSLFSRLCLEHMRPSIENSLAN